MQRLRRCILLGAFVVLFGGKLLLAQGSTELRGTVTTVSGEAIAGATVSIINLGTQAITNVTSDAQGAFDAANLTPGSYMVTSSMKGFDVLTRNGIQLAAGQSETVHLSMQIASNSESVTVTAEGSPETSVTEATISKAEIEGVAGPFGSAAQALTAAPGVYVYGYGGVAATARSEVVLRGIKAGWSSVNGDVLRNGVTFLFDGIPMNNLSANNGQWQTTQIPIMDMINNVDVTYGPGGPSNRWYDSIGGTVNYMPVQTKSTPGPDLNAGVSIGSYNTYIEHFIARTGNYKGWSALLAFGYASNDTFRVGTIGIPTFNAPSSGYATLAKVDHYFDRGSLSFGFYHGRNTEFRPNFLPIAPITPASNNNTGDAVTTIGLFGPDSQPSSAVPPNVQYYSQQTSGFYSSLAKDLWFKQIKTQSDIAYAKLELELSPRVTMHNSEWFRHGYRLHNRVVNFYGPNYAVGHEWYNPASNTIGSSTSVDIQASHNLVTVGGYWMHQGYKNPVATFNPALGTSKTQPSFFNADQIDSDFGYLYGQDRIDLLHQRLIITPGLAEQYFRTHYYNIGLSFFPQGDPANDPEQAPDSHKTFSQQSPSVGAQYRALSWLTFHGNFAITYENPTDSAFGANQATNGVNVDKLKAVKSDNRELGFLVSKCPFAFLGACSLDATYFHDQLSNVNVVTQVAQISTPATIALASSIYNGVSVNFDESPNRYLQVHGNGIIQHDYFLSFIPNGSPSNYRGFPIANSPRYSTNLGLTSAWQSGDKQRSLTPGLWWQYVGQRYLFSNLIAAPTKQEVSGYGVVNFNMDGKAGSIGQLFHMSHGRGIPVLFSLGIENLFNRAYNPTAYITSGGYFGTSFGGYTLVDPGAPREYIVSINIGKK